jgi:ligand-binding sensor domain-containing protein/two-component sensor histidine kinase
MLKTRFIAVSLSMLALLSPASRALDPHQQLRQYGYQSWQTDSGLPQNTVHDVLQTRDGYLWFATEGGLVRFDGMQFAVFTQKDTPQLGSDLVNCLMEDRLGVLWIGTSSGVTRYAHGQFERVAESGPPSAIWALFEDSSGFADSSGFEDSAGTVWALTAAGLTRFDGRQLRSVADVPPLDETSQMVSAGDGATWLATTEGLFLARSKGFVRVGDGQRIVTLAAEKNGVVAATADAVERCDAKGCRALPVQVRGVHALVGGDNGEVWIGTDNGVISYDGAKASVYTSFYTGREGLPSDHVNLLFRDREGSLWVGTDGGIARIAGGKVEAFTPREGFSSDIVLAMREDREGNLWLGTESGGVDILRDRTFTTYTAQDGISDDHIRAVFQDHAGTIWLGTNGGGLDRKSPEGFTALTTADGLSSNVVLAVAGGEDGDLWLGTPDGLDRLHGGTVKIFTSADGVADDFVRSLYFDPQGTLWIGTRRGLSQWKDGRFTTYTAMDGLGSDLVGAVHETHDGSFWIATLGGLTRFDHRSDRRSDHRSDQGRFHNYTEADGLSNNVVTALYEDAEGSLWIGTHGGGLNRYRNGSFRQARQAGLPANIYSILEDGSGHLWLSSNHGIFRVERAALNRVLDGAAAPGSAAAPLPVEMYGVADGMRSSESSSGGHPAAWRMQDGTLWFATLKGVAAVDPAHLAVNRVPPLVSVEQFSIDDVPQAGAVVVAPGSHRLAFSYAGLSFAAPDKVRYKYMLSGFDHGWIDAGARRTAFYTNLPPGRYGFRVMAANNDGVWSTTPAVMSFRLRPYFHQTIWFYLLLALTAGLLGYGIYLWRLRQVESRFQLVLAERSRIAREIHDTLAQGFVAVSVQLQMVSRMMSSSAEAARTHLDQAQTLVRTGLDDARRAIWDLRSQGAANSDLASELVKMAERITEGNDIKSSVDVHGTYHPLPPQTESELLRIAQEAVTNAVRHAGATRIHLRLRYAARRVEMSIEDDGRGFAGEAPSAKEGHFGLIGMKERAERIGGTLGVSSSPGRGTRIQIEVPLHE